MGCNGMGYAASVLLPLADCGRQRIPLGSSMHEGVVANKSTPKGRPSIEEPLALLPCHPTPLQVASYVFPSSLREKVKRLLGALGKFKMFIRDFSFASL